MHAICANQVTCAAPGCHHPGTVAVEHTAPTREVTNPKNGRVLYFEGATVSLEYCEEHAPDASG